MHSSDQQILHNIFLVEGLHPSRQEEKKNFGSMMNSIYSYSMRPYHINV